MTDLRRSQLSDQLRTIARLAAPQAAVIEAMASELMGKPVCDFSADDWFEVILVVTARQMMCRHRVVTLTTVARNLGVSRERVGTIVKAIISRHNKKHAAAA